MNPASLPTAALRQATHSEMAQIRWQANASNCTRSRHARHTAATVLLILGVPERTVMSLMGWSSTDMAARYQHVTDPIRQDVARQVDGLIWQAVSTAAHDSTIPVSRDSLAAILRLAELGLAHADEAVMAEVQEAMEEIRAVLASAPSDQGAAAGELPADTSEPDPGTAPNPARGKK